MTHKHSNLPLNNYTIVQEQHPGQANRVHIGTWRNQTVAIRVPNRTHKSVNEFYDGVQTLFGVRYVHPYHYSNMYAILAQHSTFPVPQLITLHPFSHLPIAPTHAFVQGTPCTSFATLTNNGSYIYGRHLSTLHSVKTTTYGQIGATKPARSFHHHLAETIEHLIAHYPYDGNTIETAKKAAVQARTLPSPDTFCPVMLDLDPSQYFFKDGRLTHLIDIDFFTYAPRTLELITLERLLPRHLTSAFIRGYQSIQPFPSLRSIREIYRTFNRLTCVQGEEPYPVWHDAPPIFDV